MSRNMMSPLTIPPHKDKFVRDMASNLRKGMPDPDKAKYIATHEFEIRELKRKFNEIDNRIAKTFEVMNEQIGSMLEDFDLRLKKIESRVFGELKGNKMSPLTVPTTFDDGDYGGGRKKRKKRKRTRKKKRKN